MKINFELLLKPKLEKSLLKVAFWNLIKQHKNFRKNNTTDILYFKFKDSEQLEFNVNLQKIDKVLLCNIDSRNNIEEKNVYYYDEFRNHICSLLNSKFEITFLSRDLSRYYAQECYPIIYDYENNLRKLFYLLFHFKEISDVKKIVKSNPKPGKLNFFVEDLDLSDLEKIIFSKLWLLNQNDEYEFCNYRNTFELIKKIEEYSEKPEFYSTWDIYIRPVLKDAVMDGNKLQKIRDIRNKVSHHKEMSYSDYKYCMEEVLEVTKLFSDIHQRIILNEFYNGEDFKEIVKFISVISEQIQNTTMLLRNTIENIKIPEFTFPVSMIESFSSAQAKLKQVEGDAVNMKTYKQN